MWARNIDRNDRSIHFDEFSEPRTPTVFDASRLPEMELFHGNQPAEDQEDAPDYHLASDENGSYASDSANVAVV